MNSKTHFVVRVEYAERRFDGSIQGSTLNVMARDAAEAEAMARKVWHPQTVASVTAKEAR